MTAFKITVPDPAGKLAAWLEITPGPLRGTETLTVEVRAGREAAQEFARDLAEVAGVAEVDVTVEAA